jgi:hypothetical protein
MCSILDKEKFSRDYHGPTPHFIDEKLKPRVVNLSRVSQLYGEELEPELIIAINVSFHNFTATQKYQDNAWRVMCWYGGLLRADSQEADPIMRI